MISREMGAGITGAFNSATSVLQISCLERSSQFISLDDNYRICIFGELFIPTGSNLNKNNFESEFLPSFLVDSNNFLMHCEGAFVFVLYDKSRKELHLVSDAFGNLALHYSHNGNSLYFSTSYRAVAKNAGINEKNENALLEYLAFEYPLSGRTFYHNVQRLPVASHLRFSDKEFTVETFFSPTYEIHPRSEYSIILDKIKELFIKNIEILSQEENIYSGLSGGFDSRMTLAALAHLGRQNVELITIGLPDCTDGKLAERLALITGFRHKFLKFDDKFLTALPDYFEQAVLRSEGGMGIESSAQFAVWENFPFESHRYLDSHGGAIYRRQLRIGMPKSPDTHDLAHYAFTKMRSGLLQNSILHEEVRNEAAAQVIRSLQSYFESLPEHQTNGDKIDRFYIEQKSAHHYSLVGNTEMNYTRLSHPLLSARIWEMISHLKDDFRSTNAINRFIIHSLAPELEKIPLDNSGFEVPYKGYNYLRYIPQIIERFAIKKMSKLSPAIAQNLSSQHSPYTARMIMNAGGKKIREIAISDLPEFDHYFNKAVVEKLSVYDPQLISIANAKILLNSLK